MLFTIRHKVIFWQQSTVASILNYLHYDCCNTQILKNPTQKVILGNVQLVKLLSSFDMHFSLPAVYDASQDKARNW